MKKCILCLLLSIILISCNDKLTEEEFRENAAVLLITSIRLPFPLPELELSKVNGKKADDLIERKNDIGYDVIYLKPGKVTLTYSYMHDSGGKPFDIKVKVKKKCYYQAFITQDGDFGISEVSLNKKE